MGKKKLIVSLAMVALSGCGIPTFWNKNKTEPINREPAVNVENKEEPTKPNPRSSPAGSSFVPDLMIKPTNAQERRETVVKGRNDPFAIIPIEPIVTIIRIPSPSPPKVRQPPPPTIKPTPPPKVRQPPPPTIKPTPPPKVRQPPPPTIKPTPPPKVRQPPPPTIKPTPPPKVRQPPLPPQPVLAREVAVTGLIQVGTVTKIIVKSPLEKYSRYVEQGQYLANGKVLVKRIEKGGRKPIVVLEELGIEVIKRVGDKVAKPEVDTQEV